jgi:uncharacterized damage-inducible protein DinB
MTKTQDHGVFEALLDSWNRNNTILLNLLRAVPEGGLEAKAMEGSPTIAVQLSHIHSTRLFFVTQTASEFSKDLAQLFRQEASIGWQNETSSVSRLVSRRAPNPSVMR